MRLLTKLLPFLTLSILPALAGAQASGLAASCPRVPVPFGPGEEASYDIKVGFFKAGEGRLTVAGVETLRSRPVYRLEMYLDASIPLWRLEYDWKSWLDTDALVSLRHTRDYVEGRTPRKRFYEIYPEESRWHRPDNDERGATLHPCPLDEISFIYYLRAQPLVPGETLTLNRYFKEDGNPVKVEVVGRDQIEVPAGRFNTIVVRPTIQTSGLFSKDGKAEIHFSDDQYRDVVYLRIEIPVAGSMTLHLKNVRRATPGS